MTQEIEYPALYTAADDYSAKSQRRYFRLLIGEYCVLAATAILAWCDVQGKLGSALYAIAFVALVLIALVSYLSRFDERWYRARAVAESVKTTAWRFMMRAEPFGDRPTIAAARSELRNYLRSTTRLNEGVVRRFDPRTCEGPEISQAMERMRLTNWKERLETYLTHRVREQRAWYARKAAYNKNAALISLIAILSIYSLAFILIAADLIQIESNWPMVSVFLLVGSGMLGFTKAKRFGELAASYQLTAREIGLVLNASADVDSDSSLSDYVNEAERAFSREHTQWVARQD